MGLLTTGVIAQRLDVDRDVVSYALRKMKIQPENRAGQVRVFSESTLTAVKEFLNSRQTRPCMTVGKSEQGNSTHKGKLEKRQADAGCKE